MNPPIAYLSRKETICCSHRLHSPHLTDAENVELYGKCNNYWGHGHNYIVEVTIRGPVDNRTGMVMNMVDLRKFMNIVLFETLDHKNLDKNIDYFKHVVSSTENLTVFIFNELKKLMPTPSLLYEVKIYETEKNIVYYRGE